MDRFRDRAAIPLALALVLVLVLAPVAALAQAYQCSIPQGPISMPEPHRDGPVREMPVTGYTLALSWSPEYCRLRKDSAADKRQCSGQGGRFGFILHGLWPESAGGSWPQWCATRQQPAMRDIRQNLCITPSARLLAHEWAKHGACMTSRPETYFRVTRILWNSLRWPDFARLSRREGLTAGAIRRAFANANPPFRPDHIGLRINGRGWLEEMRLCYGRDFLPERCDARRFGPADDAPLRIWRGL